MTADSSHVCYTFLAIMMHLTSTSGHGRKASFSNAQEKDAVLQAFLTDRGCQG